jgi:hypothetical protein
MSSYGKITELGADGDADGDADAEYVDLWNL